MSDENEVVVQDDEEEIVVVDELPKDEGDKAKPEPDPELEALREENKRLKARGDTGEQIRDGFEFLKEKLTSAGVPQAPAPVDDEEAFWKGVEEGLFDKQPRDVLKKAIDRQARKLVRDELGPILVSQMESAFENAEWRLRNDAREGEIFTAYEKEIKAKLAKLPGLQGKDPRALRDIFMQVKAEHVDDILASREKKRDEEKKTTTSARPRTLMEAGTQHPAAPEKRKVFITKAEAARAKRLGMSNKDFLELKEARKAGA
jgi:hypothetical protein